MRLVEKFALAETAASAEVVLDYDARRKCRQRVRLDSGEEIALLLPRGTVLAAGDRLQSDDGLVIRVVAAPELLSWATTGDPLQLARAAYHLGNRHVPLQIEPGALRYRHDHVLDALVLGLGLSLTTVEAPFDPESGAYHAHGHSRAGGGGHPPDHEGRHD
jgi:urease accessory protein